MTNERAVEILNLDLDILGQYGDETAEAYKMAIKALDAQPCEDCISREVVLSLQTEYAEKMDATTFWNLRDDIRALPSVTPQPCKDCISRDDVDAYIAKLMSGYLYDEERTRLEEFSAYLWELPSVIPKGVTVTDFADRCRECGRIKTSEDAVSREAVEEITFQEPSYTDPYNILTEVREKVRALPTVTSERPKGTWIQTKDECDGVNFYDFSFECSKCGKEQSFKSNYCPNCGAEMIGGGEDENNSGC